MDKLTIEQQATNYETMLHIMKVQQFLHKMVKSLLDRAEKHDLSKLQDPEVQAFTENTAKLSKLTYGSAEYFDNLKEIKPALDHHYANNRHHPQFHKNGIEDMNIVDILEMFCDWNASCKRHNDGNIKKSLEVNSSRFNMNPQLVKILENSIDLLEG